MLEKLLIWVVPFVAAMSASLAGTVAEDRLKESYNGHTADEWGATLKAPDAESRRLAAEALAGMGRQARDAMPQLIEAVNDQDAVVRRFAVQGLGNIGPEAREANDVIADKLMDGDKLFLRHAVQALRKIAGPMPEQKKPVPQKVESP